MGVNISQHNPDVVRNLVSSQSVKVLWTLALALEILCSIGISNPNGATNIVVLSMSISALDHASQLLHDLQPSVIQQHRSLC